jgi:hypothetical protein
MHIISRLPSLEGLLRLDCEADGYFGFPVENLKGMIPEPAMVLALGPFTGSHFDPAVASLA